MSEMVQPGRADRARRLRRAASGPAHDPLGGTTASADVRDALRRRSGGGQKLPAELAAAAGEHLGADLSGVRVHSDSEADRIARSVQSKAFTYGSDIYFTQGTYAPTRASGNHVLAHELAHVAQNQSGRGASGGASAAPTIGRADDPAEAAAERVARSMLPALRRQAARVSAEEGGAP